MWVPILCLQGKLDVLLMQWTTSLFPDRRTGAGGAGVKLLAFRQDFREDHAFLKVLGEWAVTRCDLGPCSHQQ